MRCDLKKKSLSRIVKLGKNFKAIKQESVVPAVNHIEKITLNQYMPTFFRGENSPVNIFFTQPMDWLTNTFFSAAKSFSENTRIQA